MQLLTWTSSPAEMISRLSVRVVQCHSSLSAREQQSQIASLFGQQLWFVS